MTQAQREKKWQIESDARTLQNYAELVNDAGRMNAAKNFLMAEAAKLEKAIGLKTALANKIG